MEPPVGFGKKCPKRIAHKRLVRMNMPIDRKGYVEFTTTFFALIRESLKIKPSADLNKSLRNTIQVIWPSIDPEKLDLLVPPDTS
jgi:voltage-dependent calcium channel N type alpha-1B